MTPFSVCLFTQMKKLASACPLFLGVIGGWSVLTKMTNRFCLELSVSRFFCLNFNRLSN